MSDDLSKVDWGKPIEAYHVDGRVVPMTMPYDGPDPAGDYYTDDVDDFDLPTVWLPNGRPWLDAGSNEGWRIRNTRALERDSREG